MTSIGARLLRTRWLVRAPIVVFRARLGFLYSGRLLLLEHTGRTSGRPRSAVLETVARPSPDRMVVASGFGTQAQWFRNLVADPRCRVSIGARHRVPALARVLGPDESAVVLDGYRREHPKAYQGLGRIIEEATGSAIEQVPLVELSFPA
ncbi:nitroreductase family deazaflavin-dependent oxidoreductase [Nocardia sp. NBC_00508]|uniref:nitroreductase family deazaflavin-dependent oxidoreductase n=1 Tax=Nocardia sp. NBC_00508 TaxID=2975992 RepID=UPI002E7FD6C8|nr:nitroreductase family deazaflavin-dependent oxidoreductase [Nocardia sp. NBC_00508]WUD68415.1 nitroreductase family deazaflavin-dependent oxidoreductase [Nocardia sp. NBC_00508]